MYLLSIFHYQNNTYLFTKSSICQTDVSTLQEQNNKTHILIVYYNFVKMTASPRIRTQGDSIPVEHTNHSPNHLVDWLTQHTL